MTTDPLPPPGYEPKDASPRVVAATAAALAGIVAVCLLAAALVNRQEEGRRSLGTPAGPDGFFQHGAQARTSIEEAWDDVDRSARDHLSSYAWVDRKAGIVRIPIDRAIDLLCSEQKRPLPGNKGTSRP